MRLPAEVAEVAPLPARAADRARVGRLRRVRVAAGAVVIPVAETQAAAEIPGVAVATAAVVAVVLRELAAEEEEEALPAVVAVVAALLVEVAAVGCLAVVARVAPVEPAAVISRSCWSTCRTPVDALRRAM